MLYFNSILKYSKFFCIFQVNVTNYDFILSLKKHISKISCKLSFCKINKNVITDYRLKGPNYVFFSFHSVSFSLLYNLFFDCFLDGYKTIYSFLFVCNRYLFINHLYFYKGLSFKILYFRFLYIFIFLYRRIKNILFYAK